MSATQIKTCKECPFARLIEDDRYVCTNSETASDTVRGHWEVTRASCHDAITQLAPSDTLLEALPVEFPVPAIETPKSTKLTKHPFAYDWSVFNGQHSYSSSMYGKCECYECNPPATPSPEPPPSDEPHLTETTTFDPEQADSEAYCANDVQYTLEAYYKPNQMVTVDVTPEPDEDSHTTPEQFPPNLNIEALAAEARKEQNESCRLSRLVPVSAVQAIANVPDYFIRRLEGAGTLRPDTVLAFMRIWGAVQSEAAEISKTINWLIGAPGFDMTNTLMVEHLIGIQRPVPPGNQSYFGVDLKEEIDPDSGDYHDRY